MRIRIACASCALVLMILVAPVPAAAEWELNGTIVCDATNYQMYPRICPDGGGGGIVAWEDDRSGSLRHVYVQRIDSYGRALWTANGVLATTVDSYQQTIGIVSDGAGGAIVVWNDQRTGMQRLYSQRFDGSGNRLWADAGVALTSSTNGAISARIAADGHGGLIAAWHEYVSSLNKVYAQRVNASGTLLWGSGALGVCSGAWTQGNPWIDTDRAYGAIVVWMDARNASNFDIYLNRIRANGTLVYGSTGTAVCTEAFDQANPRLVTDGATGAVIAWEDFRNYTDFNLYATRYDTAGSFYGPTTVCTAANEQDWIDLAPDGAGGAYASWLDHRNGSYDVVYVQRILKNATVGWTADGLPASASPAGWESDQHVINDGAGNVLLIWSDARNGGGLYAQRMAQADGARAWGNGLAVCTIPGIPSNGTMASDGARGALVTWCDLRTTPYDIYAQRIERNGYWGFPCGYIGEVKDIPHDQGGKVTVTWDASRLDVFGTEVVTHYSIWRRLDRPAAALLAAGVRGIDPATVGRDFKGPAYRFESAAGTLYGWEWVGNQDAHYFDEYTFSAPTYFDSTAADGGMNWFLVSAHTSSGFVFWDSPPDSGWSVDNLAPCVPVGLAGEQHYSPAGLHLTWRHGTEADLGGYAVYRGTSEDFVPDPGNRIASSCDTFLVDGDWSWDGGYYYKVRAVDIHGNESRCALLRPDEVTVSEEPSTPRVTALTQNFPNPFNPTTTIAYDLAAPGRVRIDVHDASGRLVAVLVDATKPAGRHAVAWNGRDARGSLAASGVYFCRMKAGSYEATRKIVLMR